MTWTRSCPPPPSQGDPAVPDQVDDRSAPPWETSAVSPVRFP